MSIEVIVTRAILPEIRWLELYQGRLGIFRPERLVTDVETGQQKVLVHNIDHESWFVCTISTFHRRYSYFVPEKSVGHEAEPWRSGA